MFLAVWAAAFTIWRLGRIEERWGAIVRAGSGKLGIRLPRAALPPTPAPPSRKPLPGSVRGGSAPTVGDLDATPFELIGSLIELPS